MPERLLPVVLLSGGWLLLRSLNAASTVGPPVERALGWALVVLTSAWVVVEAWRAATPEAAATSRWRRRGRVGVVALLHGVAYALLTGMVTFGDVGVASSWTTSYGPLTSWPLFVGAAPWAGVSWKVSMGRLVLLAALSVLVGLAIHLTMDASRRRRCAVAGAGVAGVLTTAGCVACAPVVLLVPTAAGAALAATTGSVMVTAFVEAAALLVGLAVVLHLAGVPWRRSRRKRNVVSALAVAGLPFVAAPVIHHHVAFAGFPRGASSTQEAIYGFFVLATIAAVVLVGLVFVVAAWWSWRYRAGRASWDAEADEVGEDQRTRRRAITAFTVVPAVIILGLGIVSYQVLVEMQADPEGTFQVDVQAQQFQWRFTYPDGTTTAHDLFVPVNEVVVLRVSSNDVIHSFSVPDLGVKIDALPRHENTYTIRTLQEGSYRGYCTEFCGAGHTDMVATVHVVPPDVAVPGGEGRP